MMAWSFELRLRKEPPREEKTMMKRLYEPLYRIIRLFRLPIAWVFGTKTDLEQLVESGRIPPGRAIDLGCGAGLEAIYLAKKGFDVTGVDFSATAIKMAREKAREEGVEVNIVQDDLTALQHVSGTFDFLMDYGAINDLDQVDRQAYVKNVLPLSHPSSQFLLMCFENNLPEREFDEYFGEAFTIETLKDESENLFNRTIKVYLMRREAVQ
jgi:cyclopropane fatty-acyl-phospholipid synthase-like methyltransferase